MFWNKRTEETKPYIRFRYREDHEDIFPKPGRANKFMPSWLKNLSRDIPGEPANAAGTVKRCVPVLDAVGQGFIIPLWADLHIKVTMTNPDPENLPDAVGPWINLSMPQNYGLGDVIGGHGWQQVGDDCPVSKHMCGKVLMKFTNPWVIETPEGYSVQFKTPSNSFSDLHIVEGVVDTDTYNRQVNFPFVWAGTEHEVDTIIPAGTPLIHVIPFKREKFDLQFDTWDHDRMTHMDMKHETVFKDKYRKLWWHKKK